MLLVLSNDVCLSDIEIEKNIKDNIFWFLWCCFYLFVSYMVVMILKLYGIFYCIIVVLN